MSKQSSNQPAASTIRPKRNRAIVWLRRVLFTVLSIILLLCLTIISVTQIPAFRHWALDYAEDEVNAELLGRIEIGDVVFNWLDGIHLYDVRLYAAADTLASISRIDLGYDVDGLFNKAMIVNFLTVESPTVKLLRGTDSVWNYERFAKPSADTTPSKPFDWAILLRAFSLRNASVTAYDSTAPPGREKTLDFSRISLRNCSIDLSGGANIAAKTFDLRIHHAVFTELHSGLDVRHLKVAAVADEQRTKIRRLRFESARSALSMKALFDGNLFGALPDSIFNAVPLSASLEADSLSTDDLRLFLPDMGVLGTYSLKLDAAGTIPEIQVSRLEIGSKQSNLGLSATLRNLDKSEKLWVDARISDSRIQYEEFRLATPVLGLPRLDFLGTVGLHDVRAIVVPSDSLSFDLNTTTASGAIKGQLSLMIARDTLGYRLNAGISAINVGRIAHSPDLNSSLNGRIFMQGQGTSLDELASQARISLSKSHIGKRKIESLRFAGSADRGGIIHIDTLNVALPDSTTTTLFDEGVGKAALHGFLDLRNPGRPVYDFAADCSMFPVHRAAGFDYPLTLDGDCRAVGVGFHPDSLETTLEANFRGIHLEDRSILSLPLFANVKNTPSGGRRLLLSSRLLDLDIEGRFSFASLVNALERQANAAVKFVEYKIATAAGNTRDTMPARYGTDTSNDTLNIRLQADIRDISPITLYLKTGTILSSGWVRGGVRIAGSRSLLWLDTISVTTLDINSRTTRVLSDAVRGSMRFATSRTDSVIRVDTVHISTMWDSTFVIDGVKFQNPRAGIRYANGALSFDVSGRIDDKISASLSGNAKDLDSAFSFVCNSMKIGYKGLEWNNLYDVRGVVQRGGLHLDSAVLFRAGAEKVSISGGLNGNRITQGHVRIENYSLANLHTFPDLPPDIQEILSSLGGNIASLTISADGALTNPVMSLAGDFTNLTYNGVLIGNQTAALEYRDTVVTGDVTIINPKFSTDNKTLRIGVEQLPLNLAFAPVQQRMSKTEPVIITALARRLSLGVFGPFIPGIKKLQGFADAEITVEGLPGHISYGGKAKIYNASMTTLSTNISYLAEGIFSLKNNEVTIDAFRLKNLPADFRAGVASINGNLFFDGFSLDSIDVKLTSPGILLMSDATAATLPVMHGKFIAATPDTSIRFFGKLDRPYLRGGLSVVGADIVMPPDKKIQANVSTFEYIVDSSGNNITIRQSTEKLPAESPRSVSPAEEPRTAEKKPRIALSIVDKTDFDLTIKVPRRMTLTMMLAKFEEIRAEILPLPPKQSLRYKQKDGVRELFGELTLSNNSEYQFLKVFSAVGKLSFINGEISNPALNLDATYSGRTSGGESRPYKVILKITGTKKLPKVTIGYELDGVEQTGDSAKIRGDALTLLMLGRTQDQLFAKSGTGTDGIGNEITSSLSAAVSQLFSGLLEGTGLVQSASINFDAGLQDISQARLNLSGQLFGDVVWRVGGTLNDFTNNSEVSIDFPANAIADYNILRNIMIQLTRSSNPNATASIIRRQKEWEIKVGVRLY